MIRFVLSRSRLGVFSSVTTSVRASSSSSALAKALQDLDTAALCDADKKLRADDDDEYQGIHLLPQLQRLPTQTTTAMAGVVRTVLLAQSNDFLGVIQGILQAQPGEILVVDGQHSNRALAGELLASEAQRCQLAGLVILNGFMRDTAGLALTTHMTCFATGVTPYAGTCLHPAAQTQCTLEYSSENIPIRPGDVMVGDQDGIVVGSIETMSKLLPVAKANHATEAVVSARQRKRESLTSLCNIEQHLEARLQGKESQFRFNI